jgi:hypothetical protein
MSHPVKRAVKSRVLVFIFAIAVAFFSLIATPVPKAGACPEFIWTINYYTDNTYTVLCGQAIHPCCGGIVYRDGCTTEFKINTFEDC